MADSLAAPAELEPSGPRPRKAFSRGNIMLYGTLIVISMYYLLPLYVMVVTSFKGTYSLLCIVYRNSVDKWLRPSQVEI